jgi:O-antigen ligase
LPRLDGRPDIENWYIAMAGLLGTFSVISLAWEKRPGALAIIGHVVGGVCGLYVIFVSQTRGVWIAIPAFMFLTFLTYVKNAMSLKKIATFVVLCGLAGAIFFNTDIAKGRIAQAKSDIQVFEVNNNADTSVGVRFQLWHTAWLMIQEHPVIGVGAGDEYKAALTDMVDRKVLPTFYNGAHSHNEVLFSTVTMGIFGLIAILMTYFVPAYYFGRHILHTDRQVRASAALGLSVCFGFFIIGSVDVLFKYKETAVIYCVASALFYACLSTRLAQLNHTDAALQ